MTLLGPVVYRSSLPRLPPNLPCVHSHGQKDKEERRTLGSVQLLVDAVKVELSTWTVVLTRCNLDTGRRRARIRRRILTDPEWALFPQASVENLGEVTINADGSNKGMCRCRGLV